MVTDMRFPNECVLMLLYGAAAARIYRPGYGGDDNHESEKYIPVLDVHCDVMNEAGRMDEIPDRCESMLARFRTANEYGSNIVMEEFNG